MSRPDQNIAMYTMTERRSGKLPRERGKEQAENDKIDMDNEPEPAEQKPDESVRNESSENVSETDKPRPKLTTLADLIHVCRDRGLQVFNDKHNQPEADKLWLKARNWVQTGHKPSVRTPSPSARRSRKSHRSVRSGRTDSTRSRHSKYSRRSKKSARRDGRKSRMSYADSASTGRHDYGTEGSYNDSDSNSLHRKASTLRSVRRRHTRASSSGHRSSAFTGHDTLTVGSTRNRMSANSRRENMTRSSVLSVLELYDENADIDAEEVLKLRMRRKSKRRKEPPVTMDERLQLKQEDIKARSPYLQLADGGPREKDTNKETETTGMPKDNGSTEKVESGNVSSQQSKVSPTPSRVSVVKHEDKRTDSERHQDITSKVPLEENETFHGAPKTERVIKEIPMREPTQHAIETTTSAQGASVKPFQDKTMSGSSGAFSPSCSSHPKEFSSNDSLNDQKNDRQEPMTSNQSQSVSSSLSNDPMYDGSELINEKVIVQRIMNEMNSRENYNIENVSKEIITENDFLTNANNDTTSSSHCSERDGKISESTCGPNNSLFDQERDSKVLNFDQHINEAACLEGLDNNSQSDSMHLSGERILNNSTDVKSDKKHHISSVEQQLAIDEHLQFQGVASIETTPNNERTISTVDDSVEKDTVSIKNEDASNEIRVSANENGDAKFTISLDADNLIVEKPYIVHKNEISSSQNSNFIRMDTTYDDRNYDNKSIEKVPKKSYGNGFLVSADVHTQEGIPGENSKNDGDGVKNVRKLESQERRSRIRHQSVSTLSKSGSQSASTSSAATPLKKVYGAARLMLLMSQLKKSYEDEEKTQQSFLKEIGITRKTLRSNYRKMQLGEDIQVESPKREPESGYDTSVKEEDSGLIEEDGIQEDSDKLDKVEEGQTEDLEQDVQTESHGEIGEHENIETTEDSVFEKKSEKQKIISEPLGENVKNAKYKVDTRWKRDGTIYRQIQSGFKSKVVIPDSSKVAKELKKLRQPQSATGNSAAYKVYMEDAQQRYMQSLQTQNQNKSGSGNEHPSSKMLSRPKTERVNSHTMEENLSERPHSDGHRHTSIIKRNVDMKTNKNGKIANGHIHRQNHQNVGTNSRIPVRTQQYEKSKVHIKQNNTDHDLARLEKDKKIISGYQDYMDNQKTSPVGKESDRKTFKTYKFTNNGHVNTNSTNAKKVKEMEFSTNAHHGESNAQSSKRYNTNHLESHKAFHTDELVNGLDSCGESMQSSAKSSPRSTTSSRRSKIPIGKAVEIMQSRNKFYEEASMAKDIPRELRVLRLFEELHQLKYGQHSTPVPPDSINSFTCSSVTMGTQSHTDDVSMETKSQSDTKLRKFLMMDYGLSDYLLKYRSNFHLKRFLHEAVDYELCSRGRSLYRQTNRKEKAFENLQQKFYPNTFSVSHQAR